MSYEIRECPDGTQEIEYVLLEIVDCETNVTVGGAYYENPYTCDEY